MTLTKNWRLTFTVTEDGAVTDMDPRGLPLMAINISPAFAVHPGEWLREEIMGPHNLSVTALASHFGVSRQAVSGLLNGRTGLTADMAIRFEKAFGLSARAEPIVFVARASSPPFGATVGIAPAKARAGWKPALRDGETFRPA